MRNQTQPPENLICLCAAIIPSFPPLIREVEFEELTGDTLEISLFYEKLKTSTVKDVFYAAIERNPKLASMTNEQIECFKKEKKILKKISDEFGIEDKVPAEQIKREIESIKKIQAMEVESIRKVERANQIKAKKLFQQEAQLKAVADVHNARIKAVRENESLKMKRLKFIGLESGTVLGIQTGDKERYKESVHWLVAEDGSAIPLGESNKIDDVLDVIGISKDFLLRIADILNNPDRPIFFESKEHREAFFKSLGIEA